MKPRTMWFGLVLVAMMVLPQARVARAGGWVTGTVYTTAGARNYKLWVPTGYTGSSPVPLVMMLHGCTQNADDFAAGTRMNQLADANGFLVVYPEQPALANASKCWNWFDTTHQARGYGEPLILATVVGVVRSNYNVNANRMFVAGLSAGAGMSVIMGATYPDLFAAIGVGAGLEYKASTSAFTAATVMQIGGPNPNQQGWTAYYAMGLARRPVRVIVFHGAGDTVAAPINGTQVIQQWAQTNDLIDDSSDNNSVNATAVSTVNGTVTNGYSYTKSVYNNAAGTPLMEQWVVQSMGHAWSGGSSTGSYSDPKGPNASQEIWRFFSQTVR